MHQCKVRNEQRKRRRDGGFGDLSDGRKILWEEEDETKDVSEKKAELENEDEIDRRDEREKKNAGDWHSGYKDEQRDVPVGRDSEQ